jgi:hypothetical protein
MNYKDMMITMTRCYVYAYWRDRAEQIGKSGSLKREGWRGGCDYSEVPMW